MATGGKDKVEQAGYRYAAPAHAEVTEILRTPKENRAALFARADSLRREVMGDAVFLRGIVEFSNICANHCAYCGIRADNEKVCRYRMDDDEILAVAKKMPAWGQTTIVLQSGEAPSITENRRIGKLIERIKKETALAVTMSVGNRTRDVYAYWRNCGMDRYLLRFETSDPELFARIHPDCSLEERLECLRILKDLGVQTGGGFMIGVPGETVDTLANNILLCRELDLDMIGVGPFIPHPDTPLANAKNAYADDPEMFFVAVAVLRLFNEDAHIPATTAFDAIFPRGEGRDRVMQCGANVFMPNVTPQKYRESYQLYPNKPNVDDDAEASIRRVVERLKALGRPIGQGPGHSIKKRTY
ncbi:MAG: [FeFe] hydrogenase H-cluster radical SAM maturase HydE [Alphaproteobacteria bacterium]|nr:[FeFe] hydrogenase H-cluster radical SAM maturase HydE [Alphaproteobacteria bacterium]